MTPEMCLHLSKNNDQPERGETNEEILARALHPIMAAAAADEEAATDAPTTYPTYTQKRVETIDDIDVNKRTPIRRLFYHPSLPYTLGSLIDLGPTFVSSRFAKIERLKDIQGVSSGVRFSRYYHFLVFLQLIVPSQFFCKQVVQSLREADMLVTAVPREFKFKGPVDILVSPVHMQKFLAVSASEETRLEWETKNGVDWREAYESIGDALMGVKLVPHKPRRELLRDRGIYHAIAFQYNTTVRPERTVQRSGLRDASTTDHVERMASYSTRLTTAITKHLLSRWGTTVAGSWESQIASKIWYMTTHIPGGPMPRPLFCLRYLEDIADEWAGLERALKEVRLSHIDVMGRMSTPVDFSPFCPTSDGADVDIRRLMPLSVTRSMLTYLLPQLCRWYEPLVDVWYSALLNWNPRDYTEILVNAVLSRNPDYINRPGSIEDVSSEPSPSTTHVTHDHCSSSTSCSITGSNFSSWKPNSSLTMNFAIP